MTLAHRRPAPLAAVLILVALVAAMALPVGVAVAAQATTLVTSATGPVSVGDQITDTATLSGGLNPTGTITFRLYGPNDATCAGPIIFTSTKTVNGNGDYTSDPFNPTMPGSYRWIANYGGDVNNDPTTNGCNESNETSIVQAADIKIVKTADHASPVSAGDQIGFTIKVFNVGAGNATGVKLSDALPTNLGLNWTIENQGAGWGASCAIATGVLTCGGASGKTVPANTTQGTTTFTVHIVSTTTASTAGTCPGTGTINNTASVTTSNDGTGQASATECIQAADIKISKAADHASPVSAGDQIGFTIKVWNAGAANATGVKLSDVLPTDAGTNWSIESQGAGFAGTCAIEFGSLTCGGAAGVSVPGNTTAGATTFTIHIASPTTASTAGMCPGTGQVENTASVTTSNDGSGQASASECVQAADIRISKIADNVSPVSAGGDIGFTLTVSNTGPGNATGVKLSDFLPSNPGLSWLISSQGSGWSGTCAIAGGVLTCGGAAGVTVPGNLTPPSSTVTVHITSTTTAATAGTCPGSGEVSNTGQVTTSNDGSDDDSASECVVAAGSGTAPDAPLDVVAAAGDGNASVSWSPPTSDGGSPITSYTVTSSGGQSASVGGTTATVGGLANGTSYTFTVTATNGNGTGPASAPSTAVTPAAGSQGSSASVPAAGGTASTDFGGGPTPADPTTTTVSVPATDDGGTVTNITESSATGSPPAGGYQFLGQQVDIVSTADTSADNPLTITFLIDASAIRAAFALAPTDPLPAANAVDVTRAEGGGPAEIIPSCTSTGSPISPTPACVSDRAYVDAETLRITVLTASASEWSTVVSVVSVQVTDKRYDPGDATIGQGGVVIWTFTGKKAHTVADRDALGPAKAPAYTSPAMISGQFRRTFDAAGTFTYGSTVKGDPKGFTGTVGVPVEVTPSTGTGTTSFTVQWATGTMSGYVFDVRYRFKKAGPGPGASAGWTNWKRGHAGASAAFSSTKKGTYTFEARIRNLSTGNVSGWSPEATISIH